MDLYSRKIIAWELLDTLHLIKDAIEFKADTIIVTGLSTGVAPNSEETKALKKHTNNKPLLLGSGVNQDNITELMRYADGAIIGSSIKKDGIIDNPVSLKRTKKYWK